MRKGTIYSVLFITVLLSLLLPGCTPGEETEPAKPFPTEVQSHQRPSSMLPVIPWNEARYYIGERCRVYGRVIRTEYKRMHRDQPTFLYVGSFTSYDRFQVIIWGIDRNNFPQPPEIQYKGFWIFVTGDIEEYNSVPTIHVKDPSQIRAQ
jgi:hypothetical protein